MIIETNPCDECECCPAFCDGDIEMCQISLGHTSPISSEKYERYKEVMAKRLTIPLDLHDKFEAIEKKEMKRWEKSHKQS